MSKRSGKSWRESLRRLTVAWALLFLVAPLLPHCQACWQHFGDGSPVAGFSLATLASADAPDLAGALMPTMHAGCHQGVGRHPAGPDDNRNSPDNCHCLHGAGQGDCPPALQGLAKVDTACVIAGHTRVTPTIWLALDAHPGAPARVSPPPPIHPQWLAAGLPPELTARVLLI